MQLNFQCTCRPTVGYKCISGQIQVLHCTQVHRRGIQVIWFLDSSTLDSSIKNCDSVIVERSLLLSWTAFCHWKWKLHLEVHLYVSGSSARMQIFSWTSYVFNWIWERKKNCSFISRSLELLMMVNVYLGSKQWSNQSCLVHVTLV